MRFGVLTSVSFFSKYIPRLCENNVDFCCLRFIRSMSIAMASTEDLQRVKERAEKTSQILENLKQQINAVKKAAVKEACLAEEKQLAAENEKLKQEVESLKMRLIVAEMGHGVRQVYTPTPATLMARMAASKVSESTSVNGPKSETTEREATKEASPAKQSKTQDKKAKSEKKEKAPKANADNAKKAAGAGGGGADVPVDISRLDMRVGKIVGVEQHPDAASLYVEKVDLGEGKTRTIVSGLVHHVPLNEMQDRIAVFMCNLKPAKLRGILSEGMIMCATGAKTEILVPPAGSVIGDRVTCEQYPGQPDALLNPKKKIWETLKPDVRTNKDKVATYKGSPFTIQGKGVVVAPTLTDAQIS